MGNTKAEDLQCEKSNSISENVDDNSNEETRTSEHIDSEKSWDPKIEDNKITDDGSKCELRGLDEDLQNIEATALSADAKESAKGQKKLVDKLTKNQRLSSDIERSRVQIQRGWRKVVTGDEGKRVRDHIKEKRKEVPVIKTIDKMLFTLGVVIGAISEFVLFMFPERFGWWFAFTMCFMLVLRWFYYKKMKWRYFMIDFCYFAIATCILGLVLPLDWNVTRMLHRSNFLYCSGPLPFAIPIWKNKLVFHDMDKLVSVYIHTLPMWLLYSQRWFGKTTSVFQSFDGWDFLFALGGYGLWQLLYFFKTEVLSKEELDADPAIVTSLRWISSDKKNLMTKLVIKGMRMSKLMEPNEDFDSTKFKTKLTFIATQFLYTLLAFLPCKIIYNSFFAHTAYALLISVWSVWNGADYYIEVFSCRYQGKLVEISAKSKEM